VRLHELEVQKSGPWGAARTAVDPRQARIDDGCGAELRLVGVVRMAGAESERAADLLGDATFAEKPPPRYPNGSSFATRLTSSRESLAKRVVT